MNELQFLLEYWRERLRDTEHDLAREQFAASRALAIDSAAKYRQWIAKCEQRLGVSA